MPSIEVIPAESVVVTPKATESKTTIGSKEFIVEFSHLMHGANVWRTAESLAMSLGVDAGDLAAWMDRQHDLCCRPGRKKEDGRFYYGVVGRLEQPPKPIEPPKVILEEDRYAMAMLHMVYSNLLKTLERYALRIHGKSPEAFTALAQARDRLSVGLNILKDAVKTDVEKLPKL